MAFVAMPLDVVAVLRKIFRDNAGSVVTTAVIAFGASPAEFCLDESDLDCNGIGVDHAHCGADFFAFLFAKHIKTPFKC